MAKEISKYINTCDIYQRMKAPQHKLYRQLVPLLQPDRLWQDIAIDFITSLLPTIYRRKAYNALLVVVDQFSKMIWYIACLNEINTPDIADRLIEEVFSY
jgi:hypothetical protein